MSDASSNNLYGRLSTLSAESVLRDGSTVLQNVYFTAPLKLLPPHALRESGGVLATQLNVSAGTMAGDRQNIQLRIGAGTKIIWTSQSYEKLHRMEPGAWAERTVTVAVDSAALLYYRPLPIIPFADSDFRGCTRINLADESARLVYADIFCGGRVARGELFAFRRYRQLLEIRLGGRLFYRDNTDLRPDTALFGTASGGGLSGIGFFEGHTHTASLILCNTGCNLSLVREWLEAEVPSGTVAAATVLNSNPVRDSLSIRNSGTPENALLVRALGDSAQGLETLLGRLVNRITGCGNF